MSLEDLRLSIKNAKIIKIGNYDYMIHPLIDGIPCIQPEMLLDIASEMIKYIENLGSIEKIVTIEAMGIPISTALSLKTNIPFTIIRKRKYGLPNEVLIEQVTGYSKSKLYINGLKRGDNVVIVDDIISTGGTLKSVILGLRNIGVNIKAVIILINKGLNLDKFNEEFNISVKSIFRIDLKNNLIIKNEIF